MWMWNQSWYGGIYDRVYWKWCDTQKWRKYRDADFCREICQYPNLLCNAYTQDICWLNVHSIPALWLICYQTKVQILKGDCHCIPGQNGPGPGQGIQVHDSFRAFPQMFLKCMPRHSENVWVTLWDQVCFYLHSQSKIFCQGEKWTNADITVSCNDFRIGIHNVFHFIFCHCLKVVHHFLGWFITLN